MGPYFGVNQLEEVWEDKELKRFKLISRAVLGNQQIYSSNKNCLRANKKALCVIIHVGYIKINFSLGVHC